MRHHLQRPLTKARNRWTRWALLLVAIWMGVFSAARADDAAEIAALNKQVSELYRAGKYAEAIPIAEKALKSNETTRGPDDPSTAKSLNNLAVLYIEMGDYAKAEPLMQHAPAIKEKALGPDHPNTAKSLSGLAVLYVEMGDYAKAEPLMQHALAIKEKALGPDHPDTARSLIELAVLYRSMGDYAKAEPLDQRALAIREKALGPDHPETAKSLNNLAMLYRVMGDCAKAEPLFQRALAIREKALGPQHSDTARSLSDLAILYWVKGDYAKAEPLYQRALAIREETLGPQHSDTATSLNNLAMLYEAMGDYAKAEPLSRRALAIYEEALGPQHPVTATILSNLALLEMVLGKRPEALELTRRADQAKTVNLGNILSFTSEQQRLAFQRKVHSFDIPATLGSAPEIAEVVLHNKGVVLDSLLEDRLVTEASQDPAHRQVIDQLRAAKQRLTQWLLEAPKDLSAKGLQLRNAERETRSREVEQLEGSLAREVAGVGKARRALSVTIEQVQGALASNQALVELLRYSHYLGKAQRETRYGAVVIAAAGEPRWVPLGASAAIEKNVATYEKSMPGASGVSGEAILSSTLRALYDELWAPIEKALPPSAKTVIISPDGDLNFVSFATLIAPDEHFIAEKYSIRYVASGRDLLREITPPASKLMAVFGNPDFGSEMELVANRSAVESSSPLRTVELRDYTGIKLPPLPGTAAECAALKAQAKKTGTPTEVFLGAEATEAQLRQIVSPRILHLATHGFFLPEAKDPQARKDPNAAGMQLLSGGAEGPARQALLKNPMHRSGLALAGAERTLDAWARGEIPPSDNDGIVTAEEVGGLKLQGAWLVTLSACDTGVGEARAGEGVMGLRRGFIQAGAQNLLMTLWAISDQTTVEIMKDFYARALNTGNAPQALADTQREWLVKLRKEKDLAEAVILAGPFIMSSQGKPQ